LRRDRVLADRIERLKAEAAREGGEDDDTDDRLRLIFTCCHPALALEARVALTLKSLGGLTTAEVARAFLVPEATMYQRLLRAKRKIADARIPYRVPPPELLPDRLSGVLAVVYLVFNEGYSPAAGDRAVRGELCGEAIRLGRLLVNLMPDEAEVRGLLALMLLHDARRAARVDDAGAYVPLDRQDPARWDAGRIAEGRAELHRALARRTPGQYQVQAAIAALHVEEGETDWPQVAALYGALEHYAPTPVVRVNRAAALAFAGDAARGLEVLVPLLEDRRMARYQPLHAAHAELLHRTGDAAGARAAYDRALELTENAVDRAELERRKAALA
ncbi:MAG: RNA polymerase subunit sigma-24, partial [Solirubrobacterales bacterium]|nr:RNA polymerase subunit sigma-24 [Solirubrobacterales bacterium]